MRDMGMGSMVVLFSARRHWQYNRR